MDIKAIKQVVRRQLVVEVNNASIGAPIKGYIEDRQSVQLSFSRTKQGSCDGNFYYTVSVHDMEADSILNCRIEDVEPTTETLSQYRRRISRRG